MGGAPRRWQGQKNTQNINRKKKNKRKYDKNGNKHKQL